MRRTIASMQCPSLGRAGWHAALIAALAAPALPVSVAAATPSAEPAAASAPALRCAPPFTPLDVEAGAVQPSVAAPWHPALHDLQQTTLVARGDSSQARFDSGHYGMLAVNESGPQRGRYLFSGFDADQAGIQRTDLTTGRTVTLWHSPEPRPSLRAYVNFSALRWTPWGGLLTGETAWRDPIEPVPPPYGRLIEVRQPLADPARAQVVVRGIVPRVAHRGLAFDAARNLYFVDAAAMGHLFRFTPANPRARDGDGYFAAGQVAVLRVEDGRTPEALGAGAWVQLTGATGTPLPGTVTVVDPNGVLALDGRASAQVTAYRGTAFEHPGDLEIRSVSAEPERAAHQVLYMTAHDKVFSVDLETTRVRVFAGPATVDAATGRAVGEGLHDPDNLAVDGDGAIYIAEGQPQGHADIWKAVEPHNGVAAALGRWASLTLPQAEGGGLYFDLTRPGVAYTGLRDPVDNVDRIVRLSWPCQAPARQPKARHGRGPRLRPGHAR